MMEETLIRLAREIDEKYYGKYRGFVTKDGNKDPQKRGRLKLRVPSVLGDEETDWALPCLPFGGLADQGFFAVPEVDAQVWVEFEEGDIHRPIWTGTFWQPETEVPAEASLEQPTTRLFKTPGGHRLQFDDAEDEEQVILHHKQDAELLIDKNGTVTLKDAKENTVTLDADAGEIVIADANGNTFSGGRSVLTNNPCSSRRSERRPRSCRTGKALCPFRRLSIATTAPPILNSRMVRRLARVDGPIPYTR